MRLLVIEADGVVRDTVEAFVTFHWRDAEVLQAKDGPRGLALLHAHAPELVLLGDLGRPGPSSYDVLAEIRRTSDAPVVMLTGRTGEADQVRALTLGADGYMLKPFSPLVLLARLQAVLRRVRMAPAAPSVPDLVAGPLAVDLVGGRVWVHGRPVPLTRAEYALLAALASARGRVLTQAALLEQVWGPGGRAGAGNLKVLVNRLRAKIEPDAEAAGLIETIRGVGYRVVQPSAVSQRPLGPARFAGSAGAR